jgi:sigma-B regulation protein RsbU (phosphoserine phosphatase)
MQPPWPAIRQALWDNRPLRQKLALGVWLCVVPISLLASLVALENAKRVVLARLEQQLMWDADQANSWLHWWDSQHLRTLQVSARSSSIRSLQSHRARQVIESLASIFPSYSYSLIERNGALVHGSGQLGAKQGEILSQLLRDPKSSYAKALAGTPWSILIAPPQVTRPCISSSVPVYSENTADRLQTIGVLSSCLALNELGSVTGINQLIQATSDSHDALPLINFNHHKPYGYALMLVVNPGSAILLGETEEHLHHQLLLLDPHRSRTTQWWPLIHLAMTGRSKTSFDRIQLNGIWYFVGVDRRIAGRSIVVVLDERSAFATVNSLFTWIWLGNLLALLVSSFAIHRICGALSKPVDQAGEALSRISHGDFGEPLPTDSSDVGRLFNYVNQASSQLQAFLADAKAHAITDAQLEEARRIQADFLIRDLPSSPQVELAAKFQPAYQIGADWYDALERDGIVFMVVADVCDKGVPSALYMSVFRSLLRLSLVKEWDLCHDPGSTICRAIGTVNTYMAETHGSTAMFATAFVGAYDPQHQRLSYVVAGHEAPLVLQGDQLQSLKLGGPALGLFPAATFQPGQCQLQAGGLLFAFSDGLPDARTPTGESFGQARIASLLQTRPSNRWTAAELVQQFQQTVQDHISTAEQFDDLTLLSLKVSG